MSVAVIWFRDNLRLFDNPPVFHAWASKKPLLALFIYEEEVGAAQKWWLYRSLESLQKDFFLKGHRLLLKRGSPLSVFKEIQKKVESFTLYTSLSPTFEQRKRDDVLLTSLRDLGIVSIHTWETGQLFSSSLFQIKKPEGYKIFKPFWKACLQEDVEVRPIYRLPEEKVPSISLSLWKSLDTNEPLSIPEPWTKKFERYWQPSEKKALELFHFFLANNLEGYSKNRNFPGKKGTSFLSPYLRFGQISFLYIWAEVKKSSASKEDKQAFLSELGWREFAYHLLSQYPHMPFSPLRETFISFPWQENQMYEKRWQEGQTGYPIVDAGMRQLWQTGWMHNRVRMIVGSFLVKDLLISWQKGAKWFLDHLLDGDMAVNSMNWQWVSGCGVDAAPYFRVFNPVLQGETFDPMGDYIRHFVPELKALPKEYIHKPFLAPSDLLKKCDIVLGKTYPLPMINHQKARIFALAAYQRMKKVSL